MHSFSIPGCALALLLGLVAASGCSKRTAPEATDTVPPANTAPADAPTNTTPTVGGVPADQHVVEHGKPGTPQDPSAPDRPLTGQVVVPPGTSPGAAAGLTPTPELDQKIAQAERGKDKKVIAAAYADRGQARLNDAAAAPRAKYPAALKDFRRALELDPANTEAKQSMDTIVAIYTSMGRPVPGG
jgi:hypothetical protein